MPFFPTLQKPASTREVTDVFAGYNHNRRIQDGEFYETKNLSTREFPLLANRQRRGTLSAIGNTSLNFTKLQAIIAKDALYWVDNGTLYANGLATGLTGLQTSKETQLVSMGAYICVFPDGKYINTMALSDYGSMGASWTYNSGPVSYSMCHQDGTIYTDVIKGTTEPERHNANTVWIDMTGNEVKVWSEYEGTWIVLETVYTRLDFNTQGQVPSAFKEYDGVQIAGAHYDDLNGSKIIYALGGRAPEGQEDPGENDWIVVIGIQDEPHTEVSQTITIERKIPPMDFVCECQNRLWGCFYGNDGTQNINEIYCCALGDFRNWEQYLGVSTDSWRASRGSDGPFTGCINYLGAPTFFKENVIHTVSVSPVGAHQISDLPARGVQQGSHKSLAVVNETLYYKARSGVVAYQGGMPADVSPQLGGERYYNAVAGVYGQRYYISMKDAGNTWQFFCFDVQRGLWIHEDGLHVECFAQVDDELYAQSNNSILALNGTVGTLEQHPEWIAETGIQYYSYPDKKYVSHFVVRLYMEPETDIQFFIEYDSNGVWVYSGRIPRDSRRRTGTITVPVRPRRCDHLRMRIEGKGEARFFSIARVLEIGSDV